MAGRMAGVVAGLRLSAKRLSHGVEKDCQQDAEAEQKFLGKTGDAFEVHAVPDDGDDQGPDQRPEYSAATAHQRGAADDYGGGDIALRDEVIDLVSLGCHIIVAAQRDGGIARFRSFVINAIGNNLAERVVGVFMVTPITLSDFFPQPGRNETSVRARMMRSVSCRLPLVAYESDKACSLVSCHVNF